MAAVLALIGPTAVGKTALALALAERLPIEVVSADSRTVYRWMDIGTAKPTLDERRRVAHHLIDVVDPDESYSLAGYQADAHAAIERIQQRGRLPVLVGGAGLYVSAVADGLAIPDVPPDAQLRLSLEERARAEGWQVLQAELARVDPVSAARIDPRNVRRVIRALEVFHATGRPFSAWQQPDPARAVACVLVGLRLEQADLYARIDARIDAWLASGFVEEVATLLARGYAPSLPSMSGLGYREVARYLSGTLDLETATRQFKVATHQYAKRQMTWFNARANITWLDATAATPDDVLSVLEVAGGVHGGGGAVAGGGDQLAGGGLADVAGGVDARD
ncbi:MAG: tRNA (adenosine(37)-N6)-dimethylallyltransferase MiaA [Chloroflexi bacterium]|nr:tRNA (adenosine(37)-N6)-dimethylallyltransferase MiaA [Chloroflexota bacterium]